MYINYTWEVFWAIIYKKSSKVMPPLPKISTWLIISWSCSSFGFFPIDFITFVSFSFVMNPVPHATIYKSTDSSSSIRWSILIKRTVYYIGTKDTKIRQTIRVFVDETEGFVKLLDLLIGESIRHLRRSQRKVKPFLDDLSFLLVWFVKEDDGEEREHSIWI